MTANYGNIVPDNQGVSSNFSPARTLNGVTRPHDGVDIAAPLGSSVYSPPVDGVVVANRFNEGGYGNYVVIMTKLGDGTPILTLYGHLETPSPLNEGDPVPAGTEIGQVGQTGNATGPSLHYEERVGLSTSLDANGDWIAGVSWKAGSVPFDPSQDYFGLTDGTPNPNSLTQSSGTATSADFPGSDPGMHYYQIDGDTMSGRIYDNGVTYTIDNATGAEWWSIPTASGGVTEITRFPGGDDLIDQKTFDSGGNLLSETDTTTAPDGTQMISRDLNGDNVVDQVETAQTFDDGSKLQVTRDFDPNGSVTREKVDATEAADPQGPSTGDALAQLLAQFQSSQQQLDAALSSGNLTQIAQVEVVTDFGSNGLVDSRTVEATDTTGSQAINRDLNGDGTMDQVETIQRSADGSTLDDVRNLDPGGNLQNETITTTAPDGSYSANTNDGQGNTETDNYGVDGTKTSDNWQHSDGSYGDDYFYSDGSNSGESSNADGSYNSYWNGSDGSYYVEQDNADGSYSDSYNYAGDGYGTDDFNADGSGTSDWYSYDGSSYYAEQDNADGSYSDSYNYAGDKHGADNYNADGSGSSYWYSYDGTSYYTKEVNSDGSWSDSYDYSGYRYGADNFNADGSGSSYWYGDDGSFDQREVAASGSYDDKGVTYYSSSNTYTYDDVSNPDGSYENKYTETFDGGWFSDDYKYAVDGSYSDAWSSSNGSYRDSSYDVTTGWSETKYRYYNSDGTYNEADELSNPDGSYSDYEYRSFAEGGYLSWHNNHDAATGNSSSDYSSPNWYETYTDTWNPDGSHEEKTFATFAPGGSSVFPDGGWDSFDYKIAANGSYVDTSLSSNGSYGTATYDATTGEYHGSGYNAAGSPPYNYSY